MRTRIVTLACLALVALPAAAQEYPKLKPGLWQLTRTSDRGTPAGGMTMTICMDEALQKEMWDMGLGAMKGMCTKTDFHISGGKGNGEFVCNMGGSNMHSKASMVLTGDTGYRTEVDTTFDPPLNGMAKSHSTVDARYTGACKAGQRPGDMLMPNGQTMNMRDMAAGRIGPGAPAPGMPAPGRTPSAPPQK